jgi:hypothetical protein
VTGFVKTKGTMRLSNTPTARQSFSVTTPKPTTTYECDFVSIFPTHQPLPATALRCSPVVIDADPVYDGQTQTVHRSELPFIRDGGWVFSWIVTNLTPEQIANMQAMREELGGN